MTVQRNVADAWPFTGRAAELDLFRHSLESNLCAILIHGTQGVGKTRLGEEFLSVAKAAGFSTLRLDSIPGNSHIPLSPLSPLVPHELVAGIVTSPEDIGAGLHMLELFKQVKLSVQKISGSTRLVILVDDLHRLDQLSLVVLSQLLDGGLIFLVSTVPQGEPVPDAVPALWSRDRSMRVDLHPLDEAEFQSLLVRLLDGPVGEMTVDQIWRACQGNLTYLRELLVVSLQKRKLFDQDGMWLLAGHLEPGDSLTDLVKNRLQEAGQEAQEVLDRLALCEPLGVDELAIEGRDRHLLIQTIERLERSGLLCVAVADRRHQLRLSHPMHGNVIRSLMQPDTTKAILAQQATRLESLGARRSEDVLRIATWRLEASGTADPALLLRAARLARLEFDFPSVERLARGILRTEENVEGALLLAEALTSQGLVDAAGESLAAAATGAATGAVKTQAVLAASYGLYWELLELEASDVKLAEAFASLSGREQAEIAAGQATNQFFSGRIGEALRTLAATPHPNPAGSPLRTLADVGAHCVHGDVAKAQALLDASESYRRAQPKSFVFFLHPGTDYLLNAYVLAESGDLEQACAALRKSVTAAITDHVPYALATFEAFLGHLLLQRGRLRAAVRWYRDVVGLAQRHHQAPKRMALTGMAVAYGQLGDADSARQRLREAELLQPTVDWDGLNAKAHAWTRAASGDIDTAVAHLRAEAGKACDRGQLAVAAALLHDMVRLGDPEPAVDELAALAARCNSPMVHARAAHASAAANGDPAALSDAAAWFEEAGALLVAAEAATQACTAYRTSGQERRATAEANRAARLISRCEGASTPGIPRSETVASLTGREREVAELVRSGLTSAEAAAKLHLSVRTINNHLQKVYGKLGIAGRGELGAVLTWQD
ncbi:AAA family ATPase [Streptomyces sp. NPDC060027]|uniref:AAA family ATPase n=1 Tax=Streptomyces sp. NPDC060027 TaxID=3347040 RepID=UPI00367B5E56